MEEQVFLELYRGAKVCSGCTAHLEFTGAAPCICLLKRLWRRPYSEIRLVMKIKVMVIPQHSHLLRIQC